MTNMEIEDVLSSIRRLVSADLRPQARPESPEAPAEVVVPVGKLVLTPAYRVADDSSLDENATDDSLTYENSSEAGPAYEAPTEEPLTYESPTYESPTDESPSGLGHSDIDQTDEGPTDKVLVAGSLTEAGSPEARQAFEDSHSDGTADDAGAALAFAESTRDWDRGGDAGQAVRAADTYLQESSPGPIPDGADDISDDARDAATGGDEGSIRTDVGSEVDADARQATESGRPWASPTDHEDEDWGERTSEPASLEETIAELEAAVAASGEEWEPDGSEMSTAAQFAMPSIAARRLSPLFLGAALAEPAPINGPRRLHLGIAGSQNAQDDAAPDEDQPAVGATSASTPTAAAESVAARNVLFEDPSETIMDEEALRELVIEVIRQELQGALGERITRNVRKLVRAEIHRAMAGREFE